MKSLHSYKMKTDDLYLLKDNLYNYMYPIAWYYELIKESTTEIKQRSTTNNVKNKTFYLILKSTRNIFCHISMSIDERCFFMAFLNMVDLYKILGFDLYRDKVNNYCKNKILEIEKEKVKDKRILLLFDEIY